MVYVIQVCWQITSRIRTELHPDPARKLSAHIPLLCVQWKTPVDGQRNCPKHVEFYSKNKFEKLVHLVGFIIRMLQRNIVHVLVYSWMLTTGEQLWVPYIYEHLRSEASSWRSPEVMMMTTMTIQVFSGWRQDRSKRRYLFTIWHVAMSQMTVSWILFSSWRETI